MESYSWHRTKWWWPILTLKSESKKTKGWTRGLLEWNKINLIQSNTHTSIMQGCGLALTPVFSRKDHGQMLIESAQHSKVTSSFNIFSVKNVTLLQFSKMSHDYSTKKNQNNIISGDSCNCGMIIISHANCVHAVPVYCFCLGLHPHPQKCRHWQLLITFYTVYTDKYFHVAKVISSIVCGFNIMILISPGIIHNKDFLQTHWLNALPEHWVNGFAKNP